MQYCNSNILCQITYKNVLNKLYFFGNLPIFSPNKCCLIQICWITRRLHTNWFEIFNRLNPFNPTIQKVKTLLYNLLHINVILWTLLPRSKSLAPSCSYFWTRPSLINHELIDVRWQKRYVTHIFKHRAMNRFLADHICTSDTRYS